MLKENGGQKSCRKVLDKRVGRKVLEKGRRIESCRRVLEKACAEKCCETVVQKCL